MVKLTLMGRRQRVAEVGRRFRGRRVRQQTATERKEENQTTNEGEEPAKTEETGTTLGKPGFRRRGNYYNRRFRTQNKNTPKQGENEETAPAVNNSDGTTPTIEQTAAVLEEELKPGMRRRAESNTSAKETQLNCDANNLGGGDAKTAVNPAM
ncbi:hypothetical protein OESDEN_16670 [Oesophagostomum dentatum]|uniref:Uncharacterized protein n=1 Tax=Oesophagostomum dentatum TaxID=61180 RepID=A0A0B1SFG1_OESDE|nr:hypothetical protein OESDEN_16670 [Oesophagostomum dentatum]